jgi:phosphate transport system permease protein
LSRGRPGRGVVPSLVLAVLLILTAHGAVPGVAAADDGPALYVNPATVTSDGGKPFTVEIMQRSAVATTGTQAHLVFNPKLVEIVDFELGPAFATAIFQFGNADDGSNASKDVTIAKANKTGVLESVAAFLLPGSGTIPAGENVFVKVTLNGVYGEGGSDPLSLQRPQLLDESGGLMEVVTTDGEVTIRPTAAPSGLVSPSPVPSGSAAEASDAPEVPATTADIYVAPASITLTNGNPARVFLVANTDGAVSSVAADLTFDPAMVEIIGIEPGPEWAQASLLAGGAGGGVDQAIAQANTTGVLSQTGVYLIAGLSGMPSGEGVFVSVLVRGKADGTSALALSNAVVLGSRGGAVPVVSASGGAPGPSGATERSTLSVDPVSILLPAVLLALLVVAVLLARSRLIPERIRRRWPLYVSLLLGLIPVIVFGGIVVMLLVNSAPVVNDPGVAALFGDRYSSKYSGENLHEFGLLPALWGSVLIAAVAIMVALPVSLAMAIVAVDFPMGPLTRLIRPMVAVLAGIPPIVYAASVPIFITVLMIPKFAANTTIDRFDAAAIGADPTTWPPADVPFSAGSYPWDLTGVANSTLLGGVLVALFLVPFVTPLFADALRDVSRATREASLALGANRSYTLRKVVLPMALPALAGATTLAMLKALGDTLIVAFAVGWSADRIPQPLFDLLERTPSLAAQGAGLIGSFETLDAQCLTAECAVGYSGALLLLLFAGAVVLVMTTLQARGRRRVAV